MQAALAGQHELRTVGRERAADQLLGRGGAKQLGGGQVNTATGDFVFGMTEAYLIEDGVIREVDVEVS